LKERDNLDLSRILETSKTFLMDHYRMLSGNFYFFINML